MHVNISELNKRIEIINYSTHKDENEKLSRVENISHECWAKVSNTSGTELIKSGSDFSTTKTRFLIRFTRKNIDTSMLIKFNDNYYNIEYVNNYNLSNKYIEIFATLKQAINYVFDTPAALLWDEYIENKVAEKQLDILTEEVSIKRSEFFTSYQSGMNYSIIFKVRWDDYESTLHLEEGTNRRLYASYIVVSGVKYNIIQTFREKDNAVIELICD